MVNFGKDPDDTLGIKNPKFSTLLILMIFMVKLSHYVN